MLQLPRRHSQPVTSPYNQLGAPRVALSDGASNRPRQ